MLTQSEEHPRRFMGYASVCFARVTTSILDACCLWIKL